jgi:hypothetical protein
MDFAGMSLKIRLIKMPAPWIEAPCRRVDGGLIFKAAGCWYEGHAKY